MRRKSTRSRGAVSAAGVFVPIAACALIGVVAGLHVHSRIEATLLGYELSSAQAEHAELAREEKTLRLELATRSSAHQLEKQARRALGMVEPDADRIHVVDAKVEVPLTAELGAAR